MKRVYFSTFFLVLVWNEKTEFDLIFKHLEVRQKYSPTRRIFNSLLGDWKCGQARSFVFDISVSF